MRQGYLAVVGLDPGWVADDDQAQQVPLVHRVPEDVPDVDESLHGGAALVDVDLVPVPAAGLGREVDGGG